MKKTVIYIIIAVLVVGGIIALMVMRSSSTTKGLEIVVKPTASPALLDIDEVRDLIEEDFPGIEGYRVKDVKSKEVAAAVMRSPYVRKANVTTTVGGKVSVIVELQEPVVRMFYQGNEFYLSHEGTCMPLNPSHYCHVLVGSSNWAEPHVNRVSRIDLKDTSNIENSEGLTKIWTLACFLADHPRYNGVFDQVALSEEGDLLLVPKLGSVIVNMGDEHDLEGKFENLWVMFDQGIDKVGWDAYKVISLKYKGQVVCTKR